MSKMDALRALREARYAERGATAPRPAAAAPRPTERPAAKPADVQVAAADEELAEERLCGHRAISGRTCTREHGHAAKSHRYA